MKRRGQPKQPPRGDWRSKHQRSHAGVISRIAKINPDKLARHDIEGITTDRLLRLRMRGPNQPRG